MECTVTCGEKWTCTISLRPTGEQKHPFSPLLTTKEEVELWILRAQGTLLCRHLPRDSFKTLGRDEIKRLTNPDEDNEVRTVTRDTVVIDIQDTSGAALRFIDLPGVHGLSS